MASVLGLPASHGAVRRKRGSGRSTGTRRRGAGEAVAASMANGGDGLRSEASREGGEEFRARGERRRGRRRSVAMRGKVQGDGRTARQGGGGARGEHTPGVLLVAAGRRQGKEVGWANSAGPQLGRQVCFLSLCFLF